MLNRVFLVLLLGVLFSCNPSIDAEEQKDYTLVLDEGIYVEQFDSTNTSEYRYTANNLTYIAGNKLIYDYYYEDLGGRRYKFQEPEGAAEMDWRERAKAWFLVDIDSLNDDVIRQVRLTVKAGLEPMSTNNPDYNQSVITYHYGQANGSSDFSSATGVIDNERNVWIHPPRDRLFQILEINPFPFIQAPYEIGNKWEWSLKIGAFWGDERWKTWEGAIENQYTYEITDKRKMQTAIGELECFEITGTATSSIGQTHLTAYFNMDIGFVKLDYTNIDSTKTVLELVEFVKQEQVD